MTAKAYRLHIENFLTIEEMDLDLTPGIQGFVGKNAAGKTNILTAVQSILEGKHDTKLIRDGSARSEVRLEEIEDGKVVAKVSRIQTERGTRLEGSGISHTTPKQWLGNLLDDVAINPVRLISDDPVKYLKQHIDIKATPDDTTIGKVEFNHTVNPFIECDRVSEQISIDRRAQYQVMRHQQELVDELRMNLPPQPEDPGTTREKLEDQRATVKAKLMRVEEVNENRWAIERDVEGLKSDLTQLSERIDEDKKRIAFLGQEKLNNDQKMSDEIREIQAKYKVLESDIESKKKALAQRMEVDAESIEKTRARVQKQIARLDETPLLSITDISKEKADIESMVEKVLRFEEIAKRYDQLNAKQSEHEAAKQLYDEMDEHFKYYAYELPKILIGRANLPVEGLEFRDNNLYVDNRHIERLSSAERQLVSVKLAVALAKAKGHIAVCLDGIEIMDAEHRGEFIKAMKDEDIRILYTRHGLIENEFETSVGSDK